MLRPAYIPYEMLLGSVVTDEAPVVTPPIVTENVFELPLVLLPEERLPFGPPKVTLSPKASKWNPEGDALFGENGCVKVGCPVMLDEENDPR